MGKRWPAFLLAAFVVTMTHAGVARATLVCKQLPATTTFARIVETGDGCEVVGVGGFCLGGTQLTGGACSSDPALPLLSSDISVDNGAQAWRCTHQLPTVDNACDVDSVSVTATSICCKEK